MLPATLQFIIAIIACAINERMQHKLDYAQEETRVLKGVLAAITGSGRILFTTDQRRLLAVAGKALTPEERRMCCQIVKPATLLAWFRQLGARKYDSPRGRIGRPRKRRDIRKLNEFIFFGERHLRYVVKEFMAHYLAERFHQGIGGQLIRGEARATNDNGTGTAIVRRSRLGGMLNYYRREAA